ncbi:TATA box-binding protein-associated factor RNA polymerase I subunit B-like [Lycium barbarum]|uniref:TATA box-binding protein-associated factor RNA polymerase I subunit B-like n=1 Tax=Lycium barbarum TaxID=112863 RepID=UPI00293F0BE5|nr:TATA box-binding protein-associated factor RNA polymerase I subunit B-like [Lycium barbarum]XP_060170017.1 TATA box-binding protein-associated factor RNA polymerase I subunit B-like [Lycium barbarum]XP_060170019.1 TATA box-binding protein-associated factor RNA polymerase I subunit B-like [Lycium barbarum]XP_060170020.1 TATA box-binding protein-associated factor RNA polymerase I subunit B-like [Lycium barbarum]XP_060170021.1 TATA box-binding protein-associated factor RNA polymerase I subunit 
MTDKRCEVCGHESFDDGGDGFFYCSRCGSQVNDIIDTGVDEDDLFNPEGMYSASQRRKYTKVSQPEPQVKLSQHSENLKTEDDYDEHNGDDGVGPAEPSDFGSSQISLTYRDYYSAIRLRYVMGVQVMIQLQCKALVEKFNVSPLIFGLVGPIWLRLLAHEKIMNDEWADNVIHESESQTQGEIELSQPTGSNKTEPHNLLGKRAVTIWHKSLSSMIPLPCSLAISFLVCHVAREAILPTDILKWTLEGKLPYFSAFLEIEKQLGPRSRSCPISTSRMFRPIKTITLQKLESLAASIARKIGLELPSVNFHAIASRYLKHLSLPVEKILPQACQVYEWSMPPELYLSDNKLRLPSRVCVMSILIVTMRILYDLNGGKWELISSRFNNLASADEDDSASHGSDLHDSTSDMNKYNYDALKLLKILEEKYNELSDTYDFSKDLQSYLLYCKDVVFAGLEPAYDDHEEERIIEDLWGFYQSHKAGKASEDGKTDSHTCNGFHHSGSSHGYSSTPKESENFRDSGCKCKMSKDDADSNTVNCSQCGLEETALRQLKEDMKENRFVYIPPRKNVKKKDGYIRYARKRDGAFLYAVHADYYILLRSCAKVAQVDVRTMHVGVLTFERRLEMLERRIDFCLCKRLPDDFCEFCRNE